MGAKKKVVGIHWNLFVCSCHLSDESVTGSSCSLSHYPVFCSMLSWPLKLIAGDNVWFSCCQ